MLAQILVALLPVQHPVNAPERQTEDGSNAGVLVTLMADMNGVPGSMLGPGPAPAVAAKSEVKK